jgi:SAM-dependent methyltransferase
MGTPSVSDSAEESNLPSLYTELAAWYHLLSAPADYWEEADFVRKLLVDAGAPSDATVLELGSGGGNNASHLKAHFKLTLVDLSEGMLDLSRTLNPECEHIHGDMRTLRLHRLFDAVFVHDAIMYMTSQRDLVLAIETAFIHCKPGGAALFMPDMIRETFVSLTTHGGHDGTKDEGRAIRYIEWTFDPDPADATYTVDFAYLLREEKKPVRVIHDTHVFGIFPREIWLSLLRATGFEPEPVADPWGREVFICKKPA